LNQDVPFVRAILLGWIYELVRTYNIDGLRIDTAPYVPREFWKQFTRASGVYTLGEVDDSDTGFVASYQGPLDGTLHYPLFFSLRAAFLEKNGSMKAIQDQYNASKSLFKDLSLLGNFVDNHDNPRFLFSNDDPIAFKSALALSLTFEGIPIVYYGSEQLFNGAADPYNREALWTDMHEGTETYEFLKRIIGWRRRVHLHEFSQVERYVDDQIYSFSRGRHFFAFTNCKEEQIRTIQDHPFADDSMICNILSEDDCVAVKDGEFQLRMIHGEVKIYSVKKRSFWERLEHKINSIF